MSKLGSWAKILVKFCLDFKTRTVLFFLEQLKTEHLSCAFSQFLPVRCSSSRHPAPVSVSSSEGLGHSGICLWGRRQRATHSSSWLSHYWCQFSCYCLQPRFHSTEVLSQEEEFKCILNVNVIHYSRNLCPKLFLVCLGVLYIFLPGNTNTFIITNSVNQFHSTRP